MPSAVEHNLVGACEKSMCVPDGSHLTASASPRAHYQHEPWLRHGLTDGRFWWKIRWGGNRHWKERQYCTSNFANTVCLQRMPKNMALNNTLSKMLFEHGTFLYVNEEHSIESYRRESTWKSKFGCGSKCCSGCDRILYAENILVMFSSFHFSNTYMMNASCKLSWGFLGCSEQIF